MIGILWPAVSYVLYMLYQVIFLTVEFSRESVIYYRDLFQVQSLTKGLVIPNLTNSENGRLSVE